MQVLVENYKGHEVYKFFIAIPNKGPFYYDAIHSLSNEPQWSILYGLANSPKFKSIEELKQWLN